MPLSRAKIYWIAAAIFGLAISLPIVWFCAQKRPPEISSGEYPKNGSTYNIVRHQETYLEKVINPIAISAYLLCALTGWLAWYTRGLFHQTARSVGNAEKEAITSERSRRTLERAYVFGGGQRLHTRDGTGKVLGVSSTQFEVHVENHGKTPGILRLIRLGFCEASNPPDLPEFTDEWPFFVSIAPDTRHRLIGIIDIPKHLKRPAIFGRYAYEDIWEGTYHSNFILEILPPPEYIARQLHEPPEAYTRFE